MAIATTSFEQKEVQVVTKQIKTVMTGVHLDLTVPEARTLALLLRHVGGSPEDTARKYTDDIMHVLHRVFGWQDVSDRDKNEVFHSTDRSLCFTDASLEAVERE